MSRPGVEVSSAAAAPPLGVPTDTSVAFIVGEAQMGSVAAPTRIASLDAFSATYGNRISPCTYSYDAVDCYFHEGGNACYFMRAADPAAIAASIRRHGDCPPGRPRVRLTPGRGATLSRLPW